MSFFHCRFLGINIFNLYLYPYREQRSAIFENVISVGSGKTQDKFEYYYSEDELCECIANGFIDNALTHKGSRVQMSGNSFAAPIITGISALLIDKYQIKELKTIRRLLTDVTQSSVFNNIAKVVAFPRKRE